LRAADVHSTGHVLVLDNERILEGDIERIGEQYRVRRTVGELWVPGNKALALCGSRQEAYEFLRGRANLQDADERLRLARWCHVQELHAQALVEVEPAVPLRPNHPETKRSRASLQQSAASPPPAQSTETPPEPDSPPASPVDLSTESLALFAPRVQPILMNACANCHATGRG